MPDHGNTGKNAATCPWPKDKIPCEFREGVDEDNEDSEHDEDEGARPAKISRVDIGVQTEDLTEYCAVCLETQDLSRFSEFRCGHKICTACVLSIARTQAKRSQFLGESGPQTADHHLLCPVCRGRAFVFSNGIYHRHPVFISTIRRE